MGFLKMIVDEAMGRRPRIRSAADWIAHREKLGTHRELDQEQRTMLRVTFLALPEHDRYLVQRRGIDEQFAKATEVKHRHEEISPSGRRRLLVTEHCIEGSWSYSRGQLFTTLEGHRIADIKRNYGSFPYLWMEDHIDGHDWLVCGDDYQGQTFVQTSTGETISKIPDEAYDGHGFCWVSMLLLEDGVTLLVDGCYWACPYQLRLYDVSDPEQGWPLLEWPKLEHPFDDDPNSCEVRMEDGNFVIENFEYRRISDGKSSSDISWDVQKMHGEMTIAAHERGDDESTTMASVKEAFRVFYRENPDHEDAPDQWERVVNARVTLKRDGTELILVDQWRSEDTVAKEIAWEKSEQDRKDRHRAWQDDSELFCALEEVCVDTETELKCGWLYPSWNMTHIKGDPNPAYFRVPWPANKGADRWATLEWGVVDGEVTVSCSRYGKGTVDEPSFPRTVDGVLSAWKAAELHCTGEEP
jgi:hypothetical protein